MSDRRHDEDLPDGDLLRDLIDDWKASSPAPPAHLEDRILRAVRAAHETDELSTHESRWYSPAVWPRPVWAAAGALAAMLVIGSMLTVRAAFFIPMAPEQADRLLVADALRDAETAEREHARAIARLEQVVTPILAKAEDPELAGAQAARLMALGNRLRYLDETIAEVNDFLQQNPGHASARTTLLAAYTEKTTVLRDVIAFDEEIAS